MLHFQVNNFEVFKGTLEHRVVIIGEYSNNDVIPRIAGYVYKTIDVDTKINEEDTGERYVLVLKDLDNENIDQNTFDAIAFSRGPNIDINVRVYAVDQIESIYESLSNFYLFSIYEAPTTQTM